MFRLGKLSWSISLVLNKVYTQINVLGLLTTGLTWDLMKSLSWQSFPFSRASVLSTTPLSAVATGDRCEKQHCEFVHLVPNLHRVGDWGLLEGRTVSVWVVALC